MISKKDFRCQRCAECCSKLTIKISKKEIKEIEKQDYTDFYEWDDFIKSNVLKRKDDKCMFLVGNKCKIYAKRPEVCRNYPFVELDEVDDCRPKMFKDI